MGHDKPTENPTTFDENDEEQDTGFLLSAIPLTGERTPSPNEILFKKLLETDLDLNTFLSNAWCRRSGLTPGTVIIFLTDNNVTPFLKEKWNQTLFIQCDTVQFILYNYETSGQLTAKDMQRV